MSWSRRLTLITMLLLACTVAGAQDDRYKQDYFAAAAGGPYQSMLFTVERFHFNERVLDAFKAADYMSVVGDLQFVLNRFPNHPRALSLLAAAAPLRGDPKLPIRHFEEALDLYPQYAVTHAQYGHYLGKMGDFAAAVLHLSEAIEKKPGFALAHAWLAEVYFKSGQPALGAAAVARARSLGYANPIEGEPAP